MSGALLPGGLPLSVGGPTKNVLEYFTVKDDFSWVKNEDYFKFGAMICCTSADRVESGSPSGTFTFDGAAGLAELPCQ